MEIENINQLAEYIIKVVLVVAIIVLLFNSFHFIDRKIDEYLPKLPRFVLYILVAILSILWLLVKLASFGVIEP